VLRLAQAVSKSSLGACAGEPAPRGCVACLTQCVTPFYSLTCISPRRNRRAATYSRICRTRYLFDAFGLSTMAATLNHQCDATLYVSDLCREQGRYSRYIISPI